MNEIEALFPFYALGVLSEEEKAQVEAFVAEDALAKARLDEMVQTAQVLPFGVIPVQPSKPVKDTLMARVHADAKDSEPDHVPRNVPGWLQLLQGWLVSPVFSGVMVALVILLIVGMVNLQRSLRNLTAENLTLQETVRLLAEENSVLREEQIAQEMILALLNAQNRREVPIFGTEFQPEAQGTLLVSVREGREAVFLVSNLPVLPKGFIYQFWLIGNSGPVGMGLFQANQQEQGVFILRSEQPVLSFEAAGVSVEPEGGSEQPTGNIVLLGNLSGN